jgi:hypothetical protein
MKTPRTEQTRDYCGKNSAAAKSCEWCEHGKSIAIQSDAPVACVIHKELFSASHTCDRWEILHPNRPVRLYFMKPEDDLEKPSNLDLLLRGENEYDAMVGEQRDKAMNAASPWRPIETAPQTNKAILVWIEDVKCPALVCWDKHLKPCPGWVHFHSYGQLLTRAPSLWMPYPEPDDQEEARRE